MIDTAVASAPADTYHANTLAGLSSQDVFEKGLHGVVVHIRRATLVPLDDPQGAAVKSQHLGRADMLLTFMTGLADNTSELGRKLTDCYTGIQLLISEALDFNSAESSEMLDVALLQARTLETNMSQSMREISHG